MTAAHPFAATRVLTLALFFALAGAWCARAAEEEPPATGQAPGSGRSGAETSGLPLPRFASLRAGEVNVRTGPGVQYPVDWVFQRQGLPVEVIAEYRTWRKIRDWQGTQGWVHQSLLAGKRTVIVIGGQRALHAKPEPDAKAVAQLEAGVVASLPRRGIQIGMGIALFAAASLMLLSLTGMGPAPGLAQGVSGGMLALAVAISMVLGALMMLGIGFYAPCLIMISLMGMNPTAAFPIMMGSCAFLMPAGSLQFIRKQKYDVRTAIGLLVGGPGAVLIAAYIVKSLPLDYVRWGVVVVVIYTAVGMLRTAAQEKAVQTATSRA